MNRKILSVRALTNAKFVCLIGVAFLLAPIKGQAQGYTITTVAGGRQGGFTGSGASATSEEMLARGIAVDSSGNLYIADDVGSVIYKVTPSGAISVVAGIWGPGGYSGDGGPATSALLNLPDGIALDTSGNLYIVNNGRVRKLTTSGMITTVAGGGTPPFPSIGDGGPAVNALLFGPRGLAVDAGGNIYITEVGASRVRKVTPGGTITTVAGGQIVPPTASLGDGGPRHERVSSGPVRSRGGCRW